MAVYIHDTLTGAAVTLASHVGETGATWTKIQGDAIALDGSGHAKLPGTSASTTFYVASGTTSSATQVVTLRVIVSGGVANQAFGLFGYDDGTGINNQYEALYNAFSGKWVLTKLVGGVGTDLATFTESLANGTYDIRLTLAPNSQRLDVSFNGGAFANKITTTDSAVPAGDYAGLIWFSAAAPAMSFDEFTADDTPAVVLTVSGPSAFQVFQRSGTAGSIVVAGTNGGTGAHDIEASWNGGSYATIASGVTAGSLFSGALSSQPQGQGTLTVRFADDHAQAVTIDYVGIGDVFVIAGQSNAVGAGTNNQIYLHPTLKAGLFKGSYTWTELLDPTHDFAGWVDAVSDNTVFGVGGSYWVPLATQLMANLNVPVAFIPCAHSSTAIADWLPGADHQDRTTLYGAMVYRTLQVCSGGVKAVLWQQGETDAQNSVSQATYQARMVTLAAAIRADLNCKLMPCKFNNQSAVPDGQETPIWAAIGAEWAGDANVAPGWDISDLISDDGYHIKTDAKLAVAAARAWVALRNAFYSTGGGVSSPFQSALIRGVN